MIAPTHVAFGLFSASSLFALFALPLHKNLPAVGFAMIGSLLPDIDSPNSSLGRLLPFFSIPLERRWGHRTITHGLLCMAGIGAVCLPLAFMHPAWYAGLLIGYASHLMADCMTKSGVPLFYPNPAVCVLPSNSRYRFRTGALAERIFLLALVALLLLVFPVSNLGGTWRALRYIMATQSMAYTDYREATTESVLEFKGRWRISRKRTEGEALILDGTAGKFLIAYQDATWVYGEQGDILPDRSRVRFTQQPIRVDTVAVQAEPFTRLREQIPAAAFVSGHLTSSRPFQLSLPLARSQHESVKVTSQELAFEYAPEALIASLEPVRQVDPAQVEQLRRQVLEREVAYAALQIQKPPVHYLRLREAKVALEAKQQELETLLDTTLEFSGVLFLRILGGKK